jgi:hypothetical protein
MSMVSRSRQSRAGGTRRKLGSPVRCGLVPVPARFLSLHSLTYANFAGGIPEEGLSNRIHLKSDWNKLQEMSAGLRA